MLYSQGAALSAAPVFCKLSPVPPVLVLVGGFLGAGKTTLLLAAAQRLHAAGKRTAIILNDQGEELVDTRLAHATGLAAAQVPNGCFCCRLTDFLAAAHTFPDVDVLFAEPVGSCTDLAATVLEPLRRLYGHQFRTAPLTIVLDPARAAALTNQPGDVPYLFERQLAEANLVVLSKADLYPDAPLPTGRVTFRVSATTGQGLDEWLHEVLDPASATDLHLLDIDYNRYAAAEAALGWVNWKVRFRATRPQTPASLAGPILESLSEKVPNIAHLKVFVTSPEGWIKASVCATGTDPIVEGILYAPPTLHHEIILNLRAESAPETLDALVEQALTALPGKYTTNLRQAFRPSPPNPSRYANPEFLPPTETSGETNPPQSPIHPPTETPGETNPPQSPIHPPTETSGETNPPQSPIHPPTETPGQTNLPQDAVHPYPEHSPTRADLSDPGVTESRPADARPTESTPTVTATQQNP